MKSAYQLWYLTNAFDSIRHDILLAKLFRIGISSSALVWFSSYLSSRKHVVRIANVASEQLELSYGVPQGSILGPVLFTLYVNELMIISCFLPCDECSIFSLNIHTVLINFIPGLCIHTSQAERHGIIAELVR